METTAERLFRKQARRIAQRDEDSIYCLAARELWDNNPQLRPALIDTAADNGLLHITELGELTFLGMDVSQYLTRDIERQVLAHQDSHPCRAFSRGSDVAFQLQQQALRESVAQRIRR